MDDAGRSLLQSTLQWQQVLAEELTHHNPQLTSARLNLLTQILLGRVLFQRLAASRCPTWEAETNAILAHIHWNISARAFTSLEKPARAAQPRATCLSHQPDADAWSPDHVDVTSLCGEVLENIGREMDLCFALKAADGASAELFSRLHELLSANSIHKTADGSTVVERGHHIRKKTGVFYTAPAIVEFIVEQTLDQRLTAVDDGLATPLRILDPACGCGLFLIAVARKLFAWNDRRKQDNRDVPFCTAQAANTSTLHERLQVLTNSVYGVDVNPTAVEFTKLALLLTALQNTPHQPNAQPDIQTATNQSQRSPAETSLNIDDLYHNIRCGNALIGSDFEQVPHYGSSAADKRNSAQAFDWRVAFPEVDSQGGFDVIVGNPPWGGEIDSLRSYYQANYPLSTRQHTDLFKLFIERATRLAAQGAMTGMVVPNTLLRQPRYGDVRQLLLDQQLEIIVDLGDGHFADVVAPACIFVARKQGVSPGHQVRLMNRTDEWNGGPDDGQPAVDSATVRVPQCRLRENAGYAFRQPDQDFQAPVLPLGQFTAFTCRDAGINYQRVNVGRGVKGNSDLGQRLLYEGACEDPRHVMFWKGADVGRYWLKPCTNRYCRCDYAAYVRPNEVVRLNRAVYDTRPKILLRQTADRLVAALDTQGVWFGRSVLAILPQGSSRYRVEYLLALLNSQFLTGVYRRLAQETGRAFAQVKLARLKQLPIRRIDFDNKAERSQHDELVRLVDQLQKSHASQIPTDQQHDQAVQEQRHHLDQQIERIVVNLYSPQQNETALDPRP